MNPFLHMTSTGPSPLSLIAANSTTLAILLWCSQNVPFFRKIASPPAFPGLPQAPWMWQILFTLLALLTLWLEGHLKTVSDLQLGFYWSSLSIGLLIVFLLLRNGSASTPDQH